jgi:hypothetical protein
MLARASRLPVGTGWSCEVKWDGLRAIVSTAEGFRILSRRRWGMLPELAALPPGLVLDGDSSPSTTGSRTFPGLITTRQERGFRACVDLPLATCHDRQVLCASVLGRVHLWGEEGGSGIA